MRCFNALRRANISQQEDREDPRLVALRSWTDRIEAVAGCKPVAASGDASFRRYFRLQKGGRSFIAMDAPPEQENSLQFVRVAGYFEAMKLNAPRIIEADIENGFLLLTDLGPEQYLDRLDKDESSVSGLYDDAIAALLRIQQGGAAFQALLPPYDEQLLRSELALFYDWLCGTHLGLTFDDKDNNEWRSLCDLLVANALDQPQVFVHRDYHSRNLMISETDNPGILDFQDAVEGPMTYDLVSLLKDCYVQWPGERVREWTLQFYASLDAETRSTMDEQQFQSYFDFMGVQRHLKAAGIFCRLNHRDGKPGYLRDVPRTLSYVDDVARRYEELEFLSGLIRQRVLPAWGSAS